MYGIVRKLHDVLVDIKIQDYKHFIKITKTTTDIFRRIFQLMFFTLKIHRIYDEKLSVDEIKSASTLQPNLIEFYTTACYVQSSLTSQSDPLEFSQNSFTEFKEGIMTRNDRHLTYY